MDHSSNKRRRGGATASAGGSKKEAETEEVEDETAKEKEVVEQAKTALREWLARRDAPGILEQFICINSADVVRGV